MCPNVQTQIPLYAEPIFHGNYSRGIVVFDSLGRRNFTAMAAASLLSAPVAILVASTPHRLNIALAARSSLYHLPLVLADQLGFFKAEGLQVDWVDCDSGSQALQMALSGQADVVSGAFEHVLDLQAAGMPYGAFVLQSRAPQISVGLASRRAAGMKHITELKSLKLGISSLGSATHWVAQHWLKQVGFSIDAVHFVELGGGTVSVMEAMRAGAVDGLCHVDPILHYLEQKNDLRILADTRTLSSTQRMYGGALASACLFGRMDFLQRKKDVALALTTGVVRALNWLKTAGPTDILKTVPSHHWMGDRALYLGALDKVRESYSLDGVFGREAVHTAGRARAMRLGIKVGKMVALERSYTNQLTALAKRKLST
jgi:NitT/TauT family transport system substrate-binding protein